MIIEFGKDRINLDDLLVVAEYTTSDGPACDDYFLVVLTRDGKRSEMPIGGPETEKIVSILSSALSQPINLRLYNRADYSSRVLYPPNVMDRPFFISKRIELKWGKLSKLLGAPDHIDEWIVDPEVQADAIKWTLRKGP